jgi:hypothetical protein
MIHQFGGFSFHLPCSPFFDCNIWVVDCCNSYHFAQIYFLRVLLLPVGAGLLYPLLL